MAKNVALQNLICVFTDNKDLLKKIEEVCFYMNLSFRKIKLKEKILINNHKTQMLLDMKKNWESLKVGLKF